MLLYSVTVHIQSEREAEWLEWMRTKHVQDVIDTGYFTSAVIHKQLEPAAPANAASYCIIYQCPSQRDLDAYQREAAPALQQEHTDKFQGHFSASRVILESIV